MGGISSAVLVRFWGTSEPQDTARRCTPVSAVGYAGTKRKAGIDGDADGHQ